MWFYVLLWASIRRSGSSDLHPSKLVTPQPLTQRLTGFPVMIAWVAVSHRCVPGRCPDGPIAHLPWPLPCLHEKDQQMATLSHGKINGLIFILVYLWNPTCQSKIWSSDQVSPHPWIGTHPGRLKDIERPGRSTPGRSAKLKKSTAQDTNISLWSTWIIADFFAKEKSQLLDDSQVALPPLYTASGYLTSPIFCHSEARIVRAFGRTEQKVTHSLDIKVVIRYILVVAVALVALGFLGSKRFNWIRVRGMWNKHRTLARWFIGHNLPWQYNSYCMDGWETLSSSLATHWLGNV